MCYRTTSENGDLIITQTFTKINNDVECRKKEEKERREKREEVEEKMMEINLMIATTYHGVQKSAAVLKLMIIDQSRDKNLVSHQQMCNMFTFFGKN